LGQACPIASDWRGLDERIEAVSAEIEALLEEDSACERLMTVPGIGPIVSSAGVAVADTPSEIAEAVGRRLAAGGLP
jgi:transposase